MSWWDALVAVGVVGWMVGAAGVLRLLRWGKDWSVGGYP